MYIHCYLDSDWIKINKKQREKNEKSITSIFTLRCISACNARRFSSVTQSCCFPCEQIERKWLMQWTCAVVWFLETGGLVVEGGILTGQLLGGHEGAPCSLVELDCGWMSFSYATVHHRVDEGGLSRHWSCPPPCSLLYASKAMWTPDPAYVVPLWNGWTDLKGYALVINTWLCGLQVEEHLLALSSEMSNF